MGLYAPLPGFIANGHLNRLDHSARLTATAQYRRLQSLVEFGELTGQTSQDKGSCRTNSAPKRTRSP